MLDSTRHLPVLPREDAGRTAFLRGVLLTPAGLSRRLSHDGRRSTTDRRRRVTPEALPRDRQSFALRRERGPAARPRRTSRAPRARRGPRSPAPSAGPGGAARAGARALAICRRPSMAASDAKPCMGTVAKSRTLARNGKINVYVRFGGSEGIRFARRASDSQSEQTNGSRMPCSA